MTEIERILNDAIVLPNIYNGNPLHHNDNLCRHQIVILLEVVKDTAPCSFQNTFSSMGTRFQKFN